jgi:hypothetical protein
VDMSEKSQITNDQVIDYVKNNSWWNEIFDEINRQQMLKNIEQVVSDHHKAEVVGAMLENIYIDQEMLTNASTHAVFQEAYAVLSTLKNGDSYPHRLVDLYISRFPRALERISDAAMGLIPSINECTVREETHRLWTTNRENFQHLDFNSLPTNLRVRTPQDRYILRALVELQELDDIFRNYQPYPFASGKYIPTHMVKSEHPESSDHAPSEADFKDRLKYLAYRVYDPLWDQWMAQYENEYVTFPLKWAGESLTITDLMRLYELHKQGSDVQSAFISFYKKTDRLERLTEAISACPVTRPHG